MAEKRAFRKPDSRRVFGQRQKRRTLFRAGLYARVSTHDQQTLPMQNRALREYAARRGWIIALQIREVGSGASERELREKLLAAARRREIDAVLVWRLDRWGRSVADLVTTLQELSHLGVGFVSITEALNLTTPAGRAMAGLLAVFAEFEREILRRALGAKLTEKLNRLSFTHKKEFVVWYSEAKKEETRARRADKMKAMLLSGTVIS
jgi:DNA invertase Pin-like site-specific DNA recombinase